MTRVPDFSPFRRMRNATPAGILTLFLVMLSVFIISRVRTVWSFIISASLFLIAYMIQKAIRAKSIGVTVNISILGVVWFHPLNGGGTMRWGNMGAVSIKENPRSGELTLVLTPLNMEEGPAMLVNSSDLDASLPLGRDKLVLLAGEIIKNMRPETVMDRATRVWAEKMGLSRGKG